MSRRRRSSPPTDRRRTPRRGNEGDRSGGARTGPPTTAAGVSSQAAAPVKRVTSISALPLPVSWNPRIKSRMRLGFTAITTSQICPASWPMAKCSFSCAAPSSTIPGVIRIFLPVVPNVLRSSSAERKPCGLELKASSIIVVPSSCFLTSSLCVICGVLRNAMRIFSGAIPSSTAAANASAILLP